MWLLTIHLDLALIFVSTCSVLITTFFYHRDGLYDVSRKKLTYAIIFGLLAGILIVNKNPSLEEFFTVLIRNGIGEELIFRFGMVGVFGIHLQIRSPLNQSTWMLILINASLFSLLHYYVYLSIFILSVLYAYFFLRFGIVSAITLHVFWNFYQRFDLVLFVFGGIIVYESYYAWRKRSHSFFRWYKRPKA
jgi:hypothetical protein